MSDIELLVIFYIPLLKGYLVEYPQIPKTLKFEAFKRFFFPLSLPLVFIYISYSSLSSLGESLFFHSKLLRILLYVVATFLAYLVSDRFFRWRLRSLKLKKYSEVWFMNRFYSDLIFSISLSIFPIAYFLYQNFSKSL